MSGARGKGVILDYFLPRNLLVATLLSAAYCCITVILLLSFSSFGWIFTRLVYVYTEYIVGGAMLMFCGGRPVSCLPVLFGRNGPVYADLKSTTAVAPAQCKTPSLGASVETALGRRLSVFTRASYIYYPTTGTTLPWAVPATLLAWAGEYRPQLRKQALKQKKLLNIPASATRFTKICSPELSPQNHPPPEKRPPGCITKNISDRARGGGRGKGQREERF